MTPVRHRKNEPAPVGRIVDLLIEKGVGQKDLMEHLGLHPNSFSEWKSGCQKSYFSYIGEIASFFGVSSDYILNGSESSEETKLIKMFRSLNAEKKKEAMKLMKRLSE